MCLALKEALLCGMLTVNPQERMSISDVFQHPWSSRYASGFESLALSNIMRINRPSQLANDSPMTLADKLTESLRKNGDLELASLNLQRNEYVLYTCVPKQRYSRHPQRKHGRRRRSGHEFCYELSVYAVTPLICTASKFDAHLGVLTDLALLSSLKLNMVRGTPRI